MSILDEIVDGVRVDLAERQRGPRSTRSRTRPPGRPAQRPDARVPRARRQRDRRGEAVPARARARWPTIADPAALAADVRRRRRRRAISVLTEQRRFGGSLDDLRGGARRGATCRCCARTSSSPPTSSGRPGPPAPTWCC